jgi:putative colanic acid biosynthesis UDP-glucose lipid carrier transferase
MLPRGLLKEHSRTLSKVLRLLDIGAIILSAKLAYFIKFDVFSLSRHYGLPVIAGVFFATFLFSFFQLYSSIRAKGLASLFWTLFQGVFTLALMLACAAFLTKSGEQYSRLWFGMWIVMSLLSLFGYRALLLSLLRYMRSHGLNERRVVIFGAGGLGAKFAESVQQALWTGYRIKAFLDDHASDKPASLHGIPVMQTPENISDYLAQNHIDEIWLALPLRAELRMKAVLHELRHHTITIRFVLDIFSLDLLSHSVSEVAGFPVLNICSTPMVGMNRLFKAIEDRLLAAIILVLISPVFLMVALAVKMSSPGPVFYRQKRIGWNGNEFEMLKFRTMPVTAESQSGPVWAKPDDGRATTIGKWLRRASIDELPQFINVLKGDMSIVGPRPERKVFVEEFKEKIPGYMQKHLMKAGITGWAQVNGWRGNTSLEKRIEYDLYYINNWSLAFDLKIIFLTMLKGFVNRNAY